MIFALSAIFSSLYSAPKKDYEKQLLRQIDEYLDVLDYTYDDDEYYDYYTRLANTYYEIGMYYYEQKNYPYSISYLKLAFELYANCLNYEEIIDNALNAYFTITNYPDKFDDDFFDLKFDALYEGISASEDARIDLYLEKDDLLKKALPLYYAAFSLFAKYDDPKSAFYYSELLRSRGFLDEIGTETALKLEGVSEKDRTEFREISKRILTLKKNTNANKEALEQANQELIELEDRISMKEPRFSWFRNPEPVDFEEAKRWCGKDRAVLEYVIFGDEQKFQPYCLVISRRKVDCVPLDPSFDYAGAAQKFRELLIDRRELNDKELSAINRTLYNKLIDPVFDKIPDSAYNLIIVPDGALSFIPFDVLSPDEKVFFGSCFNLSMSPSVSISMMNEEKSVNYSRKLLGFGNSVYSTEDEGEDRAFTMKFLKDSNSNANPNSRENLLKKYAQDDDAGRYFDAKRFYWSNIPGTGEEIHNLQDKIFGKKITIVEKMNASEANLKSLSDSNKLMDYNVIHFACHGYFDSDYPQMSSIVLTEVSSELEDRGEQDGYLTLQEASLLNINCELVNLSACQTGLAKINQGDGMTGLVRSFLVAGSKKVGVTLWCVDDEATCEFMTRMYAKVHDYDFTFQEAYSEVKDEFRKSKEWSSPYYWAAFILYE